MLLIARRYLLSTKSHSVVNIIAWVSLLSLLLPVAAVVILLSIFNGLGAMVSDIERYVEGDLTLRLREGRHFSIEELEADRLRSIDGVEALSFVSDQMALLSCGDNNSLVTLRGVDRFYGDVVGIEERLYTGDFTTHTKEEDGESGMSVILGHTLAAKLGARSVGRSVVEAISLKTSRLQRAIGVGRESRVSATLAGILSLDPEYDERYAYTSIEDVNSLIGREGVATRVSIKVNDRYKLEETKRDIEAIVGDRYRVEGRSELNPTMHQIIRYEKLGVLLISSFVMLLASFSLIGALTMLIIEKSDDITTLRAVGMTRGGIESIFFKEGLLIGGVAIAIGVALGSLVTLAQQYFGMVELPTSSMTRIAYPVDLQLSDVVSVMAIALVLTVTISRIISRKMVGSRINS